jgi:predicted transcriptional regulator
MFEERIYTVSEIAQAFMAKNELRIDQIPELFSTIGHALDGLSAQPEPEPEAAPHTEPAVPVADSVQPDFIVCLDDGKKFKSMKRHLGQIGMTPDEYRAKWDLPSDYPMVAPSYAAQRSELAKSMGLGRKRAPAANGAAVQQAA